MQFVDENILNDIRPYDEKAKEETPWYQKALLNGAPHQYRPLRLIFQNYISVCPDFC